MIDPPDYYAQLDAAGPCLFRHGGRTYLEDHARRLWRVVDVRIRDVPLVYREPPDPEATHRLFRGLDGQRVAASLAGYAAWRARGSAPSTGHRCGARQGAARCSRGSCSRRTGRRRRGRSGLAVM